tara:strand:- start:851 stop:1888 length:1038 start_codon:yes stop_codon:yes gene_type:complete
MNIHENVKDYYGKILKTNKNLKTNACTVSNKPNKTILNIINNIPNEIKEKFYGCGSTIPMGINGLNILDLGSGSGQDCYIASALVGETGSVIGVDMTDEQIKIANKHINSYTEILNYKKPNMIFKKEYIECLDKLDISNNSIDIVISNCVINLVPDKKKVISDVYNLLKNGGSFYFSDIYCDRRLDDYIKQDKILWGECIAGALYEQDFKRICNNIGFIDIREINRSKIKITDPKIINIVGNAQFYSITYNLFKIDTLETLCEDYGQYTIYNGTIPENKNYYILDNHHTFFTNKPALICGNTADILSKSWLSKHFTVYNDKSIHYGLFDACSTNDTNYNETVNCC